MFDMKMKYSREVVCSPCESETEEERYPCVYLDITEEMQKAVKGLAVGDSVTLTLKAKVKEISLRDPKKSYAGNAGSLDFEIHKADIKSGSTVFSEMTEEDDE